MKKRSNRSNLNELFSLIKTPQSIVSNISNTNLFYKHTKIEKTSPIEEREFSLGQDKSNAKELFNCISVFDSENSNKRFFLKKKIQKNKISNNQKKTNRSKKEENIFENKITFLKKEKSSEKYENNVFMKTNKEFEKIEIINLVDYIKNRNEEIKLERTFICEHCGMRFTEPSSLGGHTAKNHPNSSDCYKKRQIIIQGRNIEKKRNLFFKQLKRI
jgi:hypothetical protein